MYKAQVIVVLLITALLILGGCTPTQTATEETAPALEKTPAPALAPAVTGEEEVAPPQQTEEESQKIAEAFIILSSPTFTRDGREDTLRLLATTALEQPFSWQFDYEFQCGHPGYGRIKEGPTPIAITRHRAELVVQEGKVISAVLDDKWDMLQQRMIGEDSTAVAPVGGNRVQVAFGEEIARSVSGDTFANSKLTGERVWRICSIRNTDDETGAPVKDLRITLESELAFDGISRKEHLTRMGPPVYEWSYGDLVEESQHKEWWVDASVWFPNYASTITPGFDASRSFDKTLFTTPGIQTLTITVTPREEWLKKLSVCVIALEDDLVNPVIISYSPTGAENIKLTPDRHCLALDSIPVKLNTPLTITVTLRVTPKVPWVRYKPQIEVLPQMPIEHDGGTTRGSSVSYTMPEVGTWTVSAKGNYVWNWGAPRSVDGSVGFRKTSICLPYLIGIAAGIVIIGLAIYFFIRRRRRRVA